MRYRANARLNPAWVALGQRGDYWECATDYSDGQDWGMRWIYVPKKGGENHAS